MRLGAQLLATCEAVVPGWVRHVEQHPVDCPCPEEHDETGKMLSRRFVTLTLPGAQLCIFSGSRMQTAYVRILGDDGKCLKVVHVPEGAHRRVADSLEDRAAWVRMIVPRLLAAAKESR